MNAKPAISSATVGHVEHPGNFGPFFLVGRNQGSHKRAVLVLTPLPFLGGHHSVRQTHHLSTFFHTNYAVRTQQLESDCHIVILVPSQEHRGPSRRESTYSKTPVQIRCPPDSSSREEPITFLVSRLIQSLNAFIGTRQALPPWVCTGGSSGQPNLEGIFN